jgi:hypothetical protein
MLDSLEAAMHLDLAELLSLKEAPAALRRLHYERALGQGLPARQAYPARLEMALLAAAGDSTGEGTIAGLAALTELPVQTEAPQVAWRAALELADLLYRLGRYEEALDRYRQLLPHATAGGDPEWILVQLADSRARLGDAAGSRVLCTDYETRWPAGVWTDYLRLRASSLDSASPGPLP